MANTAERLLQKFCSPEVVNRAEQGEWPDRLWQAVQDAGLHRAWLSEQAGGSAVDVGDVLAMLKVVGRHAAPVPLAETLLAGWLLEVAQLPIPDGPLSVAPVSAQTRIQFRRTARGWLLSGVARQVPWGASAGYLVVAGRAGGQDCVAMVETSRCLVTRGRNMAGEARDDVDFTGVTVNFDALAPAPLGISQGSLWHRGALTRVALMTGALEKVMSLTLRYAGDRVQFGKPIGKFQAVQQQLALMSAEVAAACVATDAAGQAVDRGRGLAETACAKVRVGEAAGIAAAMAHQIHGAIGVTHEHTLNHSTRRLWSWRDEFGGEVEWAGYLGHWIVQPGPEAFWPALTSHDGFQTPGA
ncbi:acyl-CoA dehydrogenase family protein [Piscinibacter sakaiensis]|uniref:acyl-CoA dehydrogenase family protein n=1 Tax=Piscinibacter sakaiensis TaxID=1547922 RepID=UPI003AB0B01C